MTKVIVAFHDHVFLKIKCDDSTAQELDDRFKFLVPNHQHIPLFKKRLWDGYIHLFQIRKRLIYTGLLHYIEEFCEEHNYDIEYEGDFSDNNISIFEAKDFIKSLGIPDNLETRDYQVDAFVHCIRKKRCLLLSPTSSGKSLIMYFITRYLNKKTLIIVPNTTLIHQLEGDFASYGYTQNIHKIYSGQEKDSGEMVTIGTWQSIFKQPDQWFKEFQVVLADECHHLKAKSLIQLMTKTTTIPYKFGFTGSLDGLETNQMTLEGLLGALYRVTDAKSLIEQGFISDLKIKSIILNHPKDHCNSLLAAQRKLIKAERKKRYKLEIDWLVAHGKRNRFITNLSLSLSGNTLILYRFVEKHGIPLYDMIKKDANIPVHLIHGLVDSEERNAIRAIVDASENSIIVASQGTMSEGVNIININNIIFASPSKSRILILQSIGRGMRKSENKTVCNIFDIADDLSVGKHRNYTLNHLAQRMKYYIEEQFNYKVYKVNL